MAAPDLLVHGAPGFSLPAFDRLAPPPSPDQIGARIEALSSAGDVVVDLFGRGGWVARAALDRQRRACSFESTPLTRLLAEVVLRPPDIRHLDAAFQVISASPHGATNLKAALGDMFATHCATCGRTVVADELIWEADAGASKSGGAAASGTSAAAAPHLVRKHYRCTICRDQLGGGEQRHAPVDEADRTRATEVEQRSAAWRAMHDRFPVLDGNTALVDQLLALQTPRQLVGLYEILQRIDGDLRAAPVEAALRLALLQALLPASRLNAFPGRIAGLRIVGGRVKLPAGGQWRERNPWLAFEDAYRLVRGFVQRLEGSPNGVVQARFREDLRSLAETPSAALVRMTTPAALRAVATEATKLSGAGPQPRARLVLGQPPLRPSQDRLSFDYLATAWVLGHDAAASLPLAPLFRSSAKLRWGWQAAMLKPTFEAVAPLVTRDARVVLMLQEGGPEALVATALGAVAAGYRLAAALIDDPESGETGIVEFVPPGAAVGTGSRTRANVSLPAMPSGAGDPGYRPGRGLFAPPERLGRGPFSRTETARAITETAVEILKARGEPGGFDRLLGEILVGLDSQGHLRRLAKSTGLMPPDPDDLLLGMARNGDTADSALGGGRPAAASGTGTGAGGPRSHDQDDEEQDAAFPELQGLAASPRDRPAVRSSGSGAGGSAAAASGRTPTTTSGSRSSFASAHDLPAAGEPGRDGAGGAWNDAMDGLLALIHEELSRPDNHRLREIEPGQWWLADRDDRMTAALPLADRVEWSIFSLLSTAGRLSETALFDRIGTMFTGHDKPDEALVRACLDSYRSVASTPERLVTAEDIPRRSHEHVELVATLAELGHRLGLNVWIGTRDQTRTLRGERLVNWLDDRELRVNLSSVVRAPDEELEIVPCLWYVRSKMAFAFELEWTAMLGEPILRRHARIPPDDRLVRFLVIAPERTELVRFKLARSPLLRQSMEAGNWHILKSNHLRALAESDPVSLDDLEPLLGLDPLVDRGTEQIPLFG
jgi:hypothetical protein